jgi:hypothetical protein
MAKKNADVIIRTNLWLSLYLLPPLFRRQLTEFNPAIATLRAWIREIAGFVIIAFARCR